jgi:hypothetical protein
LLVYDNGVTINFTADINNGTFNLTHPPVGMVTTDVMGLYSTLPSLMRHLAINYGEIQYEIDGGEIPTDTIGIYVSQPISLDQLLTKLMKSVIGWWGFTHQGVLRTRMFNSPDSDGVIIHKHYQLEEVSWQDEDKLIRNVPLLYRRNWSPLEAAKSVDVEQALWLRGQGAELNITGGKGKQSLRKIECYFDEESITQTIGKKAIELFGKYRKQVRLQVPLAEFSLELGTSFTLKDTPVDGFYRITHLTERWDTEIPILEIEGWG